MDLINTPYREAAAGCCAAPAAARRERNSPANKALPTPLALQPARCSGCPCALAEAFTAAPGAH